MKFEELSVNSKVTVNVAKYYNQILSPIFDYMIKEANNEKELKNKIKKELSQMIGNLTVAVKTICEN